MATPLPTAARARRRSSLPAALAAMVAVLGAAGARADDPDALWGIVHGRCVPDQRRHGDPAPCVRVDLRGGVERGYAVLKDRRGETQFLLIPTARIRGIESPDLLAPDAPNFFAAAWRARALVQERLGRPLPRDAIGLAVNSAHARSQTQLHIHIDCLRADVRDALRENADRIGERWAPLDVPLAGRRYRAMRVSGEELGQANPFRLLADAVPGAKEEMGRYTLVVAGATFAGGEPGFVVLARRAALADGDWGWGEGLQDHACAAASGPADGTPR